MILLQSEQLQDLYKPMNICTTGKCSYLLPTIGKDLKFLQVLIIAETNFNYIAYAICKAMLWPDGVDCMTYSFVH